MSERDAIVAWLREDAGKTRQDLSRMHARHQLNMAQTAEWESIITLKSGIADAIERGDHLPASVADRYRDSDIAAHVGEVERLREATDILQRLHDYDSWGGKGFHASKAFNAKEDGKAFLARQTLEASR